MSIINTRHLKPIIKPFDREWNYIQHVFIKLNLLLVLWSCKCDNMLRNKITSLWTLVNWVCSTTLSIFPHWISKPCIQKYKNHSKASSRTGRLSENLRACKKSQFIICNCKSGKHNRQHTFMHRKLGHKTTLTNILYTHLKFKGRKKRETKIPSPLRWNWMICAINLRQDATLLESKKTKPHFIPFNEPNLCNDYILKGPE